jgi:hypothetical protein
MTFSAMRDKTFLGYNVIHCEKHTTDDFLQQRPGFIPRSIVVRGDLFAVVAP